jgi:uncharacterized membrane protein
MIYSVIFLIIILFVFFWVIQQHKKAQIEYYENNWLTSIQKMFANTEIKDEHREIFAQFAGLITDKDKDEYLKILQNEGDILGAVAIAKDVIAHKKNNNS